MDLKQQLEQHGYHHVRRMDNGEWCGVMRMMFTIGFFTGLDECGYSVRYCYQKTDDAVNAAINYNGVGDPPGPWIKMKGGNRERLGPGAKEGIDDIIA